MAFRLGPHISYSDNFLEVLSEASFFKFTTFQFFLTPQQNKYCAKPLDLNFMDTGSFRQQCSANDLVCVAHAPYVINLAAVKNNVFAVSRISTVHLLRAAAAFGVPYMVIHSGSVSGYPSSNEAFDRLAEGLHYVLEKTVGLPITILLENSAGKTGLGKDLESLAGFVRDFNDLRVRLCLDTAHAFAAGYDFDNEILTNEKMAELVKVVHFNVPDPGVALGSGRDRHSVAFATSFIESASLKNFFVRSRSRFGPDTLYILERPYDLSIGLERSTLWSDFLALREWESSHESVRI